MLVMTFSIAIAAAAFALIFPVEFPDKTFVATLVLATRFRPLLVWIGMASAFLVQTVVAVLAGQLLANLPRTRLGRAGVRRGQDAQPRSTLA